MRSVSLRMKAVNCPGDMAMGTMPWLVMFFSTKSRSLRMPLTAVLEKGGNLADQPQINQKKNAKPNGSTAQ